MNNDKLLRAFIEAQGYEIEEVETKIPTRIQAGVDPRNAMPVFIDSFDVVIDYKVTKKKQDFNNEAARIVGGSYEAKN